MNGQGANQNETPQRATACDAAVKVATILSDAGHVAYFAGGCVRDRLLGLEPTDYDIATDATPTQVASIFNRTLEVGASFGVMLVQLLGHSIEVTTFRADGTYSDHRHPDQIAFSDALHDAQRRDFTINGLFEDPLEGGVIDYVEGRADLERGIIRSIGDPHARLSEDRLRMLRAVRFAARLGFQLAPGTAAAIRAGADHLQGVSRERIGQEIQLMLRHERRALATRLIQDLGLDGVVLLEAAQPAALPRLSSLPPEASYELALAAWRADRAGGITDLEPRTSAASWAAALILSVAQETGMARMLEIAKRIQGDWGELGVAGQKRLASQSAFDEALTLVETTDEPLAHAVRLRVGELAATGLAPKPFLDGNDLIELGLSPGPAFKGLLDRVYDAQLEGRIADGEAARQLAKELAGE